MSELLNEEEVEMEVTDEYGEVIYSGTYEEFLAQNDYDEELEDILNCVQDGNPSQWTNENDEMFIIREVV